MNKKLQILREKMIAISNNNTFRQHWKALKEKETGMGDGLTLCLLGKTKSGRDFIVPAKAMFK